MSRCGKFVQAFRCIGLPSAYFLYFFTNLNWNKLKCGLISIFCHRWGKHLDVIIIVRRCCYGLSFEGTCSKIFNSIFDSQYQMSNSSGALPLSQWLSFQGSFSPELWFIRCSRYASSKNTVKECSMECNLGLLQNKIHLFSRSCTFNPFSEPSLESKPCSIQSILIKTFVTTFIEDLVFSIKNLPHKWISIDLARSFDTYY